jgi:outer membrane beta-barrel protein
VKHPFLATLSFLLIGMTSEGWALTSTLNPSQDEYEKSIEAVVRHKDYYKAGRLEGELTAGVMPYDSLINHYMVGGRLIWHITDHLGWEFADIQGAFSSVSSFTTNLVTSYGISNLQTQRIHLLASSNFLVSPIYGKFHLIGRSVVHFDAYLLGGFGVAYDDTLEVSAASTGAPAVQSNVRTGFDPLFDIGVGFKFFLNNDVGLVFDMRDYVVYSQLYSGQTLKSNYSVFLGLCFFLPTFG